MIDYYESEAEAKKEKPKKRGTISLCGYWVNEDANNGMLQRLTKLAEKMGVDMSQLPKGKQYPPNTMELHHSRRQSYYIQVEDPAEFRQWLDQMRNCVWRASGFKNKDEVHKKAFHKAVHHTRRKLGRWGWWEYGGTEEQILSDLIADEIDWTILGGVYSKLAGPWAVRWAVRNQILKIIDKMVLAAVGPAWKLMDTAVTALRPKIEPKVSELATPIGTAKGEVMLKIRNACMSIIEPLLKEHVAPHLAKILAAIQSPMTEAFQDSIKLWNDDIAKYEAKASAEENKKEFHHLDHAPYSHPMWEITRKADVMYDPLWALNIVFTDIYPWSLINDAHEALRGTMDNAMYTYETRLLEAFEKGEASDVKGVSDALKSAVMADYQNDAKIATVAYYQDIMMKIIMPMFNKLVFPAAESVLEPITSAIPEAVTDFIDINDMFQQIVTGVVADSVAVCLSSA